MTMEQACRLCNLALQEPWQGLINLQVLDEFRDSDGSILNLRSKTFAMSVASLPRGLGELWAVTTLRLPALNSLPEELTAVLQNLTKESFMECIKCVKRLPESIVDHPHLRDATELHFGGSNLVILPERFGELKNLQTLNLSGCENLVILPERFGGLTSLKDLDLRGCRSLESLPEGFGELASLEKLFMRGCASLVSLPEDFGELKSLTSLNLSGGFGSPMSLRSLPEGFGELKALTHLSMSYCYALQSLPERFGELKSLTTLNLHESPAGNFIPASLEAQLKAQGCRTLAWGATYTAW